MALFNLFKKKSARSFDAAKGTRYTADWVARRGTGDSHLKTDIVSLRERARDLERNEGYAESLFIELESNIIGEKGIQIKPTAMKADMRAAGGIAPKLDVTACEKIAQAWADFSKKGKFDVTRQFSRPEFERLVIRSVARDGGFLVRSVDGFPNNDYRHAVQGWEIDALNPRFTDNKRRIHMGIEHDEWDAPIAYHLETKSSKDNSYSRSETERFPAEEMLHLFMSKRLTQSHGFSWLAPVMTRLRHLGKYEESEVIAARVQSNKQGFIEIEGDAQYTGDEDENGNVIMGSAPGEWERLPAGAKAHLIDPTHPNGNYPEFRKAILRGVCAGIYVNYNTLAKDLEGVSYSSIRQGVISERDIWRLIQSWFIDEFEIPTFERWLKMALTTGQIEGLSLRDLGRVCHAEFSGRTWNWVDPLKDIQAAREEIALNLNSRQGIARDKGKDFAKIIEQNKEDYEMLEAAGLNTSTEKQPKNNQPEPPQTEED